jgi:hypothetical protein
VYRSGVECARKLLQVPAPKRPTAIFASNDEMAAGVLAVAHGLGLAIPEDLAVPYDRSGHVVESALMFRQSHGPSPDRSIIARARNRRRATA